MDHRRTAVITGSLLALGVVMWCSLKSQSELVPAERPSRASATAAPETTLMRDSPAFEREVIESQLSEARATPRQLHSALPATALPPEPQEPSDPLAELLDGAALTFVSEMPDIEALSDVMLAIANAAELIPGTEGRRRDVLEMHLSVRGSKLEVRALVQPKNVSLMVQSRRPRLPSPVFASRAIQCTLIGSDTTLAWAHVSVFFEPDVSGQVAIEPLALCNGHSFTLQPGSALVQRREGTLTTDRWSPTLKVPKQPWPACHLLAYRKWLELVRRLAAEVEGTPTEREPAPRGWAFVDGVSLPPPHVVTTEGLSILINGRCVERELPEVKPQPPTRYPQPATRAEAVEELRGLQIERLAEGASLEAVTLEALKFLKRQAFVTSARQVGATTIDVRCAGDPYGEHVSFLPLVPIPSREQRQKRVRDRAEQYEKSLRSGAMLVFDHGGLLTVSDGSERIAALTKLLASPKPREQKIEEVTRILGGVSLAAEHIVDCWGH